jgi:anti-sigma regulatory factor (Ser/Thr protein kinase)
MVDGSHKLTSGIDIFRRLAYAPASVIEARGALSMLEWYCEQGTFQTLRLLVTELVGNSVRHASERATGEIELAIRVTPGRIRVEVADRGPGFFPAPRDAGPDDPSGRGLLLVEALSDRWGAARKDEQMRVWFELDGSHGAAEDPEAGRIRPRAAGMLSTLASVACLIARVRTA